MATKSKSRSPHRAPAPSTPGKDPQWTWGLLRTRPPATPLTIPDPATFARQRLAFHPDPQQEQFLLSPARQGILNCSRQWGKSTVAAIKAVHRALYFPNSTILVTSPALRQSGEFLLKARAFTAQLQIPTTGDGINRVSLRFPNGSRIVALPGTHATIRGFSAVSLLILDEASQIADDLYRSMSPALILGNGDVWLISTPYGKRGTFYEIWEHGGDDWTRFQVPATDCPRITAEALDRERRKFGDPWFRQEYLCEFIGSGLHMFDRTLIERALEDIQPWHY